MEQRSYLQLIRHIKIGSLWFVLIMCWLATQPTQGKLKPGKSWSSLEKDVVDISWAKKSYVFMLRHWFCALCFIQVM